MINYRHMRIEVALVFLVFGLTAPIFAQDIWEKPFTQWTKTDVEKIVNNSPWARTEEERVTVGYGNPPISYKVIVRLRSALPIRHALVRSNQLNAKYDQMSVEERVSFDAKTKGLLDCPACANNYVISMNSPITRGPGDDVVGVLKDATLPQLKPYIYLANDKGERRELIHFATPKVIGDEAMFFFPRLDGKGQPLITNANKEFSLYIDPKLFDNRQLPFTRLKFNVSRLLLNGEVAF